MRAWYLTERRRRVGGRPRGLRALLPGWVVPFDPPPPPPAEGVAVLGVVLYGGAAGDAVVWRFTSAVTAAEGEMAGLVVSADGSGFYPATSAEVFGDGSLLLRYDGAFLEPGGVWRVDGTPAGLTFASGTTLDVPQSGVITG